MPAPKSPKLVVVDGSNIATEGRSAPSLKQLNEAVLAFIKEFPDTKITVVVDASFGHRIDRKESAEFDDAVNNNELVTPPAGAIGRGDAFVLAIADKVNASILSNDSYQEFHGHYPWLFEQGRLLGGKPVPHVGWIFVERAPVRGEKSKRAMRTHDVSKRGAVSMPKKASKEANAPMPVPKTPPPGAGVAVTKQVEKPSPKPVEKPVVKSNDKVSAKPAAKILERSAVNDVLPFISFVEKYPIGSKVKCIVESYSAHGAYVSVGDVKAYAPLRLLGSPPPRSARDALKIGQSVQLVVAGFTPSRRSIEVGVAASVKVVVPPKPTPVPPKKSTAKVAKKTVPAKRSATAKKAAPVKVAVAKKVVPAVKKATAVAKKVAKRGVKSTAKKAK